ncbi:unnamed protein product [Didymodactylos carnosus]|uniref:phosphoenolpyruvate carboxykinase (GTP) n=1 Tax=Didymodactylos carnosus TaxID=1234261 RepID=A0A814A2Z1_9BILA|nr:unnamed protein product [Didymodactylos carnosus]CAF0907221.1 unnamed protein product [Didymodactylos carnosus]CAF3543894.1 unnamed protein product [Didymodactylos carnosus]CAF3688824.1 unnamed protein product [Didymodactylos carnosus]
MEYCAKNQLLDKLPKELLSYVQEKSELCKPDHIYVCDGSEEENKMLLAAMEKNGEIRKSKKHKNCWLATTDPRDVARVESRTIICTKNQHDVVSTPKSGFRPIVDPNMPNIKQTALGNWMDTDEMILILNERFNGCMKGRTMFVIPYMMGPFNCPYSKIGVELTDSPYVVCSMRIMTRMGERVLNELNKVESPNFIKCLHSVGVPLPAQEPIINNWPCNPAKTIITHFPERNEIITFGSGYGGNSLCGKKCFALRIGSILAKKEGWLAEHMLIMGVTNPKGEKKYFCAAFPSACGKTNLAMLQNRDIIPGYKIECVGDDIAWMRFDEEGRLRAINPEFGFFGVAPGTSQSTNPIALEMIKEDTIFTNVAETSNGDVYWEGLENDVDLNNVTITSWKNQPWQKGSKEPAAHPNSRFCTYASRCSIIDPNWESPEGVPIEAIIFGGRRPTGVPLVYEVFDWDHGVFVGATMRSESTAAAEFTNKQIMNDPFAMRPFLAYNFGQYLSHWLSIGQKPGLKLPKMFHVNWFLKDPITNQFLWPGFGENIRIIDWIFRRLNNENCAIKSPIGYLPEKGSINLTNLKNININQLFHIQKDFWLKECKSIREYFVENVNDDLPKEMWTQLDLLENRIQQIPAIEREKCA